MSWLASYDTFARSKAHVQVRTWSGGLLSAVAGVVMVWLLISEFSFFRSMRIEDHLTVDTSQGDRDFNIEFEIDMLEVVCRNADMRVEDSKGVAYEDARLHIQKIGLAPQGVVALSVGMSPDAAPGCKLKGSLTVRKVAGNFHVAAGHAFGMGDGHFAYSVSPLDFASYNASHVIRHLSFGPRYPGQVDPLDGVTGIATKPGTQFQYHLKVVPTLYEPLSGYPIDSQQFSATDFIHAPEPGVGGVMQPGVWLRYDFSPIMVRMVEARGAYLMFLTSVCAILGGIYALSGLVDTVFHRTIAAVTADKKS